MLSVDFSALARAYCPSLLRPWFDRLEASNIGSRLARGAFWSMIATVFTRAFSLSASFIIARLLGQSTFGEYGVIIGTVGLMGVIAGLGIGTTVAKYTAELRVRDPARAGRIIGLSSLINWSAGAICAVVFWRLSPWFAVYTLNAPHLTSLLRLSAFWVMFSIINGAQMAALAGFEAFKARATVDAWCGILQTIFTVVGCIVGGLPGLIVGLTIGQAMSTTAYRIVLVRQMRRFAISIPWRQVFTEWRVFLHFSLPLFFCNMLTFPTHWARAAFLANQPNGYAQLGIYNAANQWNTALQILPALLGSAILPVLSERYSSGDMTASIRIMKSMMAIAAILATPMALALCLLSKPLMALYGHTFIDGYRVLMVCMTTSAINIIIIVPAWQIVVVIGKTWMWFFVQLGWAATIMIATWFMISWGAEGLAISRLLTDGTLATWWLIFILIFLRKAARTSGKSDSTQEHFGFNSKMKTGKV